MQELFLTDWHYLLGPWFAGHFVESNDGSFIGAVFMWGTYIDGYILPVAFTFIFSSIFVSDNSILGST